MQDGAKIKVIGLGGAGNNAINRMIEGGLTGVEFIAANTDAQVLAHSHAEVRIQMGDRLTRGLGAGADPSIGEKSAEEDWDRLKEALEGADMVFITAGMGGGTGTGSAPVVAQVSQELEALTVAVVTKPFSFEGPRRMQQALEGIRKLQQHVDALIVVSNDRLLSAVDHKTSVKEAFFIADQVLHHGVKGVSDIINVPGLINVDFADVRSILTGAGQVIMGIGAGRGENLVQEASERAINSALLETTIEGASKLLVNVVGGEALTLHDAQEIVKRIREATGRDDANVLFGVTYQEDIGDEVRVIMVATGFNEARTIVSPAQPFAAPAAQGLRARVGKRFDYNPDDTEIPAFLRYNPDAD